MGAFRRGQETTPRQVKDLLEIQWEATRGVYFTKEPIAQPVLAMYLLDEKCYLMLDIPNGASKHFCLDGKYYVEAVRRGSVDAQARLPLPDEIRLELVQLVNQRGRRTDRDNPGSGLGSDNQSQTDAIEVAVYWRDPIREMGIGISRREKSTEHTALKPVGSHFPFVIPDGICERGDCRLRSVP